VVFPDRSAIRRRGREGIWLRSFSHASLSKKEKELAFRTWPPGKREKRFEPAGDPYPTKGALMNVLEEERGEKERRSRPASCLEGKDFEGLSGKRGGKKGGIV